MGAAGILLLTIGALLLRQVAVGRAKETPQDLRDFAVALLNGDTATAQSVFAQRGVNVSTTASSEVAGSDAVVDALNATTVPGFGGRSALATECKRLGSAARGYSLGATGPTYYDCSGLIYRALLNIGPKPNARFTTSTFTTVMQGHITRVTDPANGDVVLWPGKHMGVYVGTDAMYSARSPSKGIGPSTISGDSSYFGASPQYWRVK